MTSGSFPAGEGGRRGIRGGAAPGAATDGSVMVIGILQFELLVAGSESLKDKRRVVSSVKDRLHREHQCSVSEIDRLESHDVAVLGLAIVGRDGRRVGEVLDAITLKLRELRDAELGDFSREILSGRAGEIGDTPADVDASDLAEEMMKRLGPGVDGEGRP